MDTPCTYRLEFNDDQYGWDLLGEVTQNAEGQEEIEDFTARPSFRRLYNFLNDRRDIGFEPNELSELLGMGLATVRKELGFGTKKALIGMFRGNRPRSVYFVGELNNASQVFLSAKNDDPFDPERGSSPNPCSDSVDPFDPVDPQFSSLSVEATNSKNHGSNGSNGSNHIGSGFQLRIKTDQSGSNVTEVNTLLKQERDCKILDKQETPENSVSESFNNSISTALSVNVTDNSSVQFEGGCKTLDKQETPESSVSESSSNSISTALSVNVTDGSSVQTDSLTAADIQGFVDMIRFAIKDPETAEPVQQTLKTFFDEHPQGKKEVWKALTKDERNSFKALTAKPKDLSGRHLKVGLRVTRLSINKVGGEITALEPQYRGSPKDRFIHWVATVEWDDGTISSQPAEWLQILEIEPLKTEPNATDPVDIKAITIYQPWASLVGKHKHYETRSKRTNYRGKIAIHAGKLSPSSSTELLELAGEDLPLGAVIAIADLVDCIEMTPEFISQQSETELKCGDWLLGRFAWKLANVRFLETPIPAQGQQGLWNWRPIKEDEDEEPTSTKWRPQAGERCQNKNGHPLTVKEDRGHSFIIIYDNDTSEGTLHLEHLQPLPPEKDPKVIAPKLFETIKPGDELRALKHPSHKGFARRRGKVIEKAQVNGKFLVKCETNDGTKVFNLEAVEVL